MALLLIVICTSLRFSAASPVLYRSLKLTDNAESYGMSTEPTSFTSKLPIIVSENDATSFDRNELKKTCASCVGSSAVLEADEEGVVEQDVYGMRQKVNSVTRLFSLDLSKLRTAPPKTEKEYLNTILMNAIYTSKLPDSQKEKYMYTAPAVSKDESPEIRQQRFSTLHSTNEQDKANLDIYSTKQDPLSRYGTFVVGHSSAREQQTAEEKITAVQLEDPTKVYHTTEHQFSYVSRMNSEHSLDLGSIKSRHTPTRTYSKDSELQTHREILHPSVQDLNQNTPTTNYNTEITAGQIEGNIHGPTTSNEAITLIKHKPSPTLKLIHQAIQTNPLEPFVFGHGRNETYDKAFKPAEHEEKINQVSRGYKMKTTRSNFGTKNKENSVKVVRFTTPTSANEIGELKSYNELNQNYKWHNKSYNNLQQLNTSTYLTLQNAEDLRASERKLHSSDRSKSENSINTTQKADTDGSVMLASVNSTTVQHNSNLVTINTEKYGRDYSDRIQLSTAGTKREHTYVTSSIKHTEESFSSLSDTSFQWSTELTKIGYSTQYNETSTSRMVIKTTGQKRRHEDYRKMEKNRLRYFPLVDREQLKDIDNLETTEYDNKLDIETLEINSSKNNNSEESAEAVQGKDDARLPTSQEPQIAGKQHEYSTMHSSEGNKRTGINSWQSFTSRFNPKQRNKDLEMREIVKEPVQSSVNYPDEEMRPVATESLSTASGVHTTAKQYSTSQITNQRAHDELHYERLQIFTLAPNTRHEDLEDIEIIEREEESDQATTLSSGVRKGKTANETMIQRPMESMRMGSNRHDVRDRNENGDRQRNSTIELRRKQKHPKHFGREDFEERSTLRNLNSEVWSKDGASEKKGENETITTDNEAATISKFIKIMKIKKQKSQNMKNVKLRNKLTQIKGTELVFNFTKVMKEKKQKYTATAEEQRKTNQNKDVKKNGLIGTMSNFTKRIRVKIVKNAFMDVSRNERHMSETVGNRKVQNGVTSFIKKRKVRNRKQILTIEERRDADKTNFTSKLEYSRKMQGPRRQHFTKIYRSKKKHYNHIREESVTRAGIGNTDSNLIQSKHRGSERNRSYDQFSAATVSNFTKIWREKKQKYTSKYLGRVEARNAVRPVNLQYIKKIPRRRRKFVQKSPGREIKHKDVAIQEHEPSVSQLSKEKGGKSKEANGIYLQDNTNARNFQLEKKTRKIVVKPEHTSTNEKTEEDIHKDALMSRLNQLNRRLERTNKDIKKQPEKLSSNKTKKKKQKRMMGTSPISTILGITFPSKFYSVFGQERYTTLAGTKSIYPFLEKSKEKRTKELLIPTTASYHSKLPKILKKNKVPRFSLHMLNTTLFVKRKKVMKMWPEKTSILFIPITLDYQDRLSKMPDQNKSTRLAPPVLSSKQFPHKQYRDRKKQPSEKTMDLGLPTIVSHQRRFNNAEQRKELDKFPLMLTVPTLSTTIRGQEHQSETKMFINSVTDTYQSKFSKRPKERKATKFGVTKLISVWKGYKHNMELPEETRGSLYPVTVGHEDEFLKVPKIMQSTRFVPTTYVFYPVTVDYKNKLLEVPKRVEFTRLLPTTDLFYRFTVDRENKLLKVPKRPEITRLFPTTDLFESTTVDHDDKLIKVPKRVEFTRLLPTTPISPTFSKRKKQKLKPISSGNTITSFIPITVFHGNKFDRFPDRNKSAQNAPRSHSPTKFTKWEDPVFKELLSKAVTLFVPTRSYIKQIHEVSRQNNTQRHVPAALNLEFLKKLYGYEPTKEMTDRGRGLFVPVTNSLEAQNNRKQTSGYEARKFHGEHHHEVYTQIRSYRPVVVLPNLTTIKKRYGVTTPVFSFLTKWKEKKLRSKWPLKTGVTSAPAKDSNEATFRKILKQDRLSKFPVKKTHSTIRQFSEKYTKFPERHTTDTLTTEVSERETENLEPPSDSTYAGGEDLTCAASSSSSRQETASDSGDSTGDIIYDEDTSTVPTFDTTTELNELDSIASDSETSSFTATSSQLVSRSAHPTTEETATGMWHTEEHTDWTSTTARYVGRGFPVTSKSKIWIATIAFKPPTRRTTREAPRYSINVTYNSNLVPSTEVSRSSFALSSSKLLTHTGSPIGHEDNSVTLDGLRQNLDSNGSSTTLRYNGTDFPTSSRSESRIAWIATIVIKTTSSLPTHTTTPDSNLGPSSGISHSSFTSSFYTSLTPTVDSPTSHEEYSVPLDGAPQNSHTDGSSTTARYNNTEAPTQNLSHSVSKTTNDRTSDLDLLPSSDGSTISYSLPSLEVSISLDKSSLATSSTLKIISVPHIEGHAVLLDGEAPNPSIDEFSSTASYTGTNFSDSSTSKPKTVCIVIEPTIGASTYSGLPSSNLFPSHEISHSSFTSSFSTSLTHKITSSTHSEGHSASLEGAEQIALTERSRTTARYNNTQVPTQNVSHSVSKTTNDRTSDLDLLPSSDGSTISYSLPSLEVSISLDKSSLATSSTLQIISVPHKEGHAASIDGEAPNPSVDKFSSTAGYIEPTSGASTYSGLPSSNLIPSHEISHSSFTSSFSTSLTHKITSSTHSEGHSASLEGAVQSALTERSRTTARCIDTKVSNIKDPQSASESLRELGSPTNTSHTSNSPSPGIPTSSTKSQFSTPSSQKTTSSANLPKSSTSCVPHSVSQNVAGASSTWSPGSTTCLLLPTAGLEHTKQRTSKRLVQISAFDAREHVSVPLTLRRTFRRRLRITRPSAS